MRPIAPEPLFVTLCVREPSAVHAGEMRSAVRAVVDWETVVELATRHGVAAIVQQTVAEAGLPVPGWVQDRLRAASLDALARVMLLDHALGRVAEALAVAGVPVTVLKGPTLARTIYSSSYLRPYGDIDITINEEHATLAERILNESGFAEVGHTDHCDGRSFARLFLERDAQVPLELHLDPLQLGMTPRCEASRWSRAQPVPQVPGALMLCPEDQVVQLSVHVHRHGFERLIWLKDLDLALRKWGSGLDWQLIDRITRSEGTQTSVWYSLRLAQMLLRTPVPGDVLVRLRPSWILRCLYALVWPIGEIANLRGRGRRRAIQFTTFESWRGVLPSFVLYGRRRDRARAALHAVLHH